MEAAAANRRRALPGYAQSRPESTAGSYGWHRAFPYNPRRAYAKPQRPVRRKAGLPDICRPARKYRQEAPEPRLVEGYWSARAMAPPVWQLLERGRAGPTFRRS